MTILDRMVLAVEQVRNRLARATRVLNEAAIPYAVIGGNAVAAWVATVDVAAVRNTQDVDLLLERENFEAARAAMEADGFVYRHVASVSMFLESPEGKARDAVHVIFAGEKVRADYALPAPRASEAESLNDMRVLRLEPLLQMKLTSFRDKDRVHIRDLLGVELIDEGWYSKLPQPLAERLRQIVENPEG